MPTSPSHASRLARALCAESSFTYAQALDLVRRAQRERMLPNVLDTEGMTQALVTLVRLAQAPSAHDPDARGFVVVVASPSGGGGKTSLALNVASALSRWRSGTETVCVVDADVTSCDVGKYLLRYSPNVVTLSQSPSSQTLESIEEFLQRVF